MTKDQERALAFGCAESIQWMTGRVPRQSRLRQHLVAWTMVVLCASLALAAGAARAGTVMARENKAGGQLRVTDIPCQGRDGKIVLSTDSGGRVAAYGCAMLDGDSILVRWDNDELSIFPFSGWHSVEAPEPEEAFTNGAFPK